MSHNTYMHNRHVAYVLLPFTMLTAVTITFLVDCTPQKKVTRKVLGDIVGLKSSKIRKPVCSHWDAVYVVQKN